MRIKRFVAPDMRTALRMVRDEQGPDAVILSNRPVAGGIEVVAATDYDEALVQQALRAAAPGLGETTTPAAANVVPMPAPPAPARRESATPASDPRQPASSSRAEAMIAALSTTPARDSVAARARAVFRVDASAAQAEAAAASKPAAPAARPQAPALASLLVTAVEDEVSTAHAAPAPQSRPAPAPSPGDDFRALLARLNAAEEAEAAANAGGGVPSPALQAADAVVQPASPVTSSGSETIKAETVVAAPVTRAATPCELAPAATLHPASSAASAIESEPQTMPAAAPQPAPVASPAPVATATPAPGATAPVLHAVATPTEDPALVAMRTELSMMRELIERQMDQYAIERLRGSAGRAHAFDTLVAYGCDEGVAQSVASRIDARLAPEETREPMFAELARMIMTNRAEPIDDGGVIALVGPTGAGKTTTAAKLAARFAARHRTRDVALVTTDIERAGAREQLHAHGRRLGITVCEAEGPEALNATLDQLADYPLVLVDTAGYAARDRALLSQILWLRTARRVRSLLVLPANAHPHDLGEVIRRYRPASPEGVVLTKTDETGRLGAALSVLVKQDLSLAYTTSGQLPADIETADPARLVAALEKLRRAADNPLMTEDRHAVA
jgi:flagellar biosynthesis protein FlhF